MSSATSNAEAAPSNGTTFQVDDMTCTHCAGVIRNALRDGLPGTPFSIDMESQRVTVDGDPAAAEAIIREAGYEPKPLAH